MGQTGIVFNSKVRDIANTRLANYAQTGMFLVSMEDSDGIQDKAWSLIFFISAWLEVN